jgi:hypothetical protein
MRRASVGRKQGDKWKIRWRDWEMATKRSPARCCITGEKSAPQRCGTNPKNPHSNAAISRQQTIAALPPGLVRNRRESVTRLMADRYGHSNAPYYARWCWSSLTYELAASRDRNRDRANRNGGTDHSPEIACISRTDNRLRRRASRARTHGRT